MPIRVLKDPGLTFDDVLLRPRFSEIHSRKEVSLKTRLVDAIEIDLPFISSTMDTITELGMAQEMNRLGALGIIHRFLNPRAHVEMLNQLAGPRILAIGVKPDDLKLIPEVHDLAAVLIDVAHGHHRRVLDTISVIREHWPGLPIIAGNIATYEAAWTLLQAGVNGVKCGLGSGSICATRIVTGIGVPQITALLDVARAVDWWIQRHNCQYTPTIISDGGIVQASDLTKAVACGASSIMLGSLLSGTAETPLPVVERDGRQCKLYRGSASKAVMDQRGIKNTAAEGVEVWVPFKGPVEPIIKNLASSVASGLSYLNCLSINELHQAELQMIQITNAGRIESSTHINSVAID